MKRRASNPEGFAIGRLLLVLSSMSPLFILWALKGTSIVPDTILVTMCAAVALLPILFLFWRIRRARVKQDTREIVIGTTEDVRYHILTYIFAMLLPFYRQDISSARDLVTVCAALTFILVLFWKLRLHYINFLLIAFGYKTFLVHPPEDDNPYSGRDDFVLITRRHSIQSRQRIMTYIVSDTVYLEKG